MIAVRKVEQLNLEQIMIKEGFKHAGSSNRECCSNSRR